MMALIGAVLYENIYFLDQTGMNSLLNDLETGIFLMGCVFSICYALALFIYLMGYSQDGAKLFLYMLCGLVTVVAKFAMTIIMNLNIRDFINSNPINETP